ncbi:MAG TPA: ATP-binding protein [Thermodesulfovibrionales bacterium]|nr:ATP-binding protein [Thermodesulfovibrionales bacterium]
MIKTIRYRFLFILILSFVISYGLLLYLVISRQAGIEYERMLNSSVRTANIISRILRESMIEGDHGFAQKTIGRLKEDANSNISVLSQKRFGDPGFPISPAILGRMSSDGQPYSEVLNNRFHYYVPITNEQGCRKCHAEKGLIGVIHIDRSVATEKSELKLTLLKLIGYGLFLMLIGSAMFFKITTYYIINPLRMINEAIQTYSKQDFSKRISDTKLKGEFSVIGNTINSMAERLSTLYGLLEQKIHRQNIEIKGQLDFVEMLVNSINSGIIFVDNSGVILKANPYTTRFIEPEEGVIIGKHLDDFIVGFYEAISVNDSSEDDFKLKSGKTVHIGYSVSEVYEIADLRGKVVLFRDLTEVVHLRSQLRRREYFSAIGEMASWIAHEIKNPLFGMFSSAEILIKTADENSKRFLESITKECNRLNRLIDDLLRYSKPVELNLSDTDLREVMSELISLVGPFDVSGKCKLVLTGGNAVPKVRGDVDKIRQVFLNLLNNSIEANATEVEIGFDADAEYVTVHIRDNGSGIDKRNVANIFRPFFTTKKKGTGLGLAICKKIIEEHGGTIDVKSDGMGTSVDLVFRR